MAKRKGDKGGNNNPVQNELFKSKQHSRSTNDMLPSEPLAKKPLTIKVYQFVYDAIAELPRNEKSIRLREILTEFAINELGAVPINKEIDKSKTA